MRYSTQWETIVERLGRWIDFQSGYRTMDVTFMESVWWVFSELFRKGLVYRGFKGKSVHVHPFYMIIDFSLSFSTSTWILCILMRVSDAVFYRMLHAAVQLWGQAELQGHLGSRGYVSLLVNRSDNYVFFFLANSSNYYLFVVIFLFLWLIFCSVCDLPTDGHPRHIADCVDHHTLDLAEQFGHLCSPRVHLCESWGYDLFRFSI